MRGERFPASRWARSQPSQKGAVDSAAYFRHRGGPKTAPMQSEKPFREASDGTIDPVIVASHGNLQPRREAGE